MKAYFTADTVIAIVALALALVLVGYAVHEHSVLVELQTKWLRQHDELVELRSRVDRLDAVLDRALDAASIARAVVEQERETSPPATR